jgi:acetoacetate decarboxylase
VSFQIDPDHRYQMPAHFGPRPSHPTVTGWYRDVTAMTLSYITDGERLAALLPEPFELGDEPLVSVVYARNREVDWLAGHGYNLIEVKASVRYRGATEERSGTYALVVWENLTDPILSGRELQGIPKLYADIADHSFVDGVWRAQASHFGHPIVDLTVEATRPATAEEISEGETTARDQYPMGWRYVPGVSGVGTALSEPTTFPSVNKFDEILVGTGSVAWHDLTWEQNPTQFHIVNALADLPILETRPAVVTKGSTNLIDFDRLPRALG